MEKVKYVNYEQLYDNIISKFDNMAFKDDFKILHENFMAKKLINYCINFDQFNLNDDEKISINKLIQQVKFENKDITIQIENFNKMPTSDSQKKEMHILNELVQKLNVYDLENFYNSIGDLHIEKINKKISNDKAIDKLVEKMKLDTNIKDNLINHIKTNVADLYNEERLNKEYKLLQDSQNGFTIKSQITNFYDTINHYDLTNQGKFKLFRNTLAHNDEWITPENNEYFIKHIADIKDTVLKDTNKI